MPLLAWSGLDEAEELAWQLSSITPSGGPELIHPDAEGLWCRRTRPHRSRPHGTSSAPLVDDRGQTHLASRSGDRLVRVRDAGRRSGPSRNCARCSRKIPQSSSTSTGTTSSKEDGFPASAQRTPTDSRPEDDTAAAARRAKSSSCLTSSAETGEDAVRAAIRGPSRQRPDLHRNRRRRHRSGPRRRPLGDRHRHPRPHHRTSRTPSPPRRYRNQCLDHPRRNRPTGPPSVGSSARRFGRCRHTRRIVLPRVG